MMGGAALEGAGLLAVVADDHGHLRVVTAGRDQLMQVHWLGHAIDDGADHSRWEGGGDRDRLGAQEARHAARRA